MLSPEYNLKIRQSPMQFMSYNIPLIATADKKPNRNGYKYELSPSDNFGRILSNTLLPTMCRGPSGQWCVDKNRPCGT